MLLAVLNRHAGFSLYDQDVFVNVIGGVKVHEPAADLAILLSVLSSYKNRRLDNDLAVFGEVIGIHLRDDCLVDGRFDVLTFNPLARLGYRD